MKNGERRTENGESDTRKGLPLVPSPFFIVLSVSLCLCGSLRASDKGLPNFSCCGYAGGGVAIPDVPVRVVVSSVKGDNGPRIQAALDYVARLRADKHGIRGAVLLCAGRYEIAGCLRITTSGVVLRGQGQEPNDTVLVARGQDRRTLIQITGIDDRLISSKGGSFVADRSVPAGARSFRVHHATGLRVGDTVFVEHPSSAAWIAALGMDFKTSQEAAGWLRWLPGKMDVRWDRVVSKIDGDTITLDAPVPMSLDAELAHSRIYVYGWKGRISQVGVENLRCESAFDAANPKDEEHAWMAVALDAVQNAWVRQMTAVHFVSSAVQVADGCKGITVEDCRSLAPASEIGGFRRHSFVTTGQLTLFQRCKAEHGRHDFAVGHLAAGPNAFVDCEATAALGFSGPAGSWATGVLYDNVRIDGGGLALTNREVWDQGVGWAAANCVLWNCTAPVITCRKPPTAQNWAVGCWGQFVGDGGWRSVNSFVKPDSLYRSQLAERLGEKAVANLKRRVIPVGKGEAKPVEDVVPSLGKCSTPDREGEAPAEPLRTPYSAPPGSAGASPSPNRHTSTAKPLTLANGWLVCDGKLLVGSRGGTAWWRGSILPARAGEHGVGVTRFVPGRDGPGFTDDLDQLTDTMRANGQAVLEHHWGLWYDRRRDDHQMVRRSDGEVWPPFYELPWARSGQGTAWDGLSKYDLTKFNPWYFGRLKQFADLCDQKGLVLFQHMYFQHNLLEAGAHWADFPWRPANCLQATGFPEPPPYVNRKRVFMAEAFYDVTHPVRRALHQAYIRKCLDALGDNTNVVFFTGEEFTGPLSFVQFWLDTIAQWRRETGKRVLVGLACTKDVQDAILLDPIRSPLVSVIDIKYWWPTANGTLFDPKGGTSLAPRQQLREWQGSKTRSDLETAKQVYAYRLRYPDKAVICSFQPPLGSAAVAAGASLPVLPPNAEASLLRTLPRMSPVEPR